MTDKVKETKPDTTEEVKEEPKVVDKYYGMYIYSN